MKPVPPNSLDAALAHLRAGKRLLVPSYTRAILLTPKTLAAYEKAGTYLLKAEGDGYRLKQGKGSVFLLPGQLRFLDN